MWRVLQDIEKENTMKVMSVGGNSMILCVAVDNHFGMTFNKRRQSQDKCLRRVLLQEAKDSVLWMNHYSAKQFEGSLPDNVRVDEDFLEKAGAQDFCFVENLSVKDYRKWIKKVILFKWNRTYPADTYFDIALAEPDWNLLSVKDIAGNSHEKITREEWENVQTR